MKFTVTPESLLALLAQVGKGLSKQKRENALITFSAARNRIAVICNGMLAGKETPVQGRGQFSISWKRFADLLSTYPQSTALQMECFAGRLEIGSFSTPVQNYQSEPVPENATVSPAALAKQPPKPANGLRRKATQEGYSPPPPVRDDSDITGLEGMVSAEDFTGPREPVTCPVCKQVGYYEKHLLKSGTYYSCRRSWVTASEALNRVVLNGKEDPVLCPKCLAVRLHTNKHITPIAGSQADIFDRH